MVVEKSWLGIKAKKCISKEKERIVVRSRVSWIRGASNVRPRVL